MFSIAEAKKNSITKHQENIAKIQEQPVIKKKSNLHVVLFNKV